MAKDRNHLAESFEAENADGWLSSFLADEDEFDRRTLWRLGSWGIGTVGAVVVAILANQSSGNTRRDQVASTDLLKQSQQIQWVAKESQSETRRLGSAIETLNSDRDRLYTRLTVLEQGLDTVTGSIRRQAAAAPRPPVALDEQPKVLAQVSVAAPSPAIAAPATLIPTPAVTEAVKPTVARQPDPVPAATAASTAAVEAEQAAPKAAAIATPATPLMAAKSIMSPPDPAAGKLIEARSFEARPLEAIPSNDPVAMNLAPEIVAAIPAQPDPREEAVAQAPPEIAVQRTEFGIDVGTAKSIDGLRTLWRRIAKSNKVLIPLRPIIVIKERPNREGMQLRLVAGPLSDAATAAKICAVLTENDYSCETSVFDGQRLSINNAAPAAPAAKSSHRRRGTKSVTQEPPTAPTPPKSSLSSLFGTR